MAEALIISPVGGSTLITSAPWSANCTPADGPATTFVISITFIPASGPVIVSGSLLALRYSQAYFPYDPDTP